MANGDGITLENKSIEIDWLNQTTLSYLKYEKWSKGQLVQTELQRFAVRWYGIEEFKLLLESIGFSNITCSADYVFEKNRQMQIKCLLLKQCEKKNKEVCKKTRRSIQYRLSCFHCPSILLLTTYTIYIKDSHYFK